MTDSLPELPQPYWPYTSPSQFHRCALRLLESGARPAAYADPTFTMTIPKRPPGRPPVPPEQRLDAGAIRLTQAQWAKLEALGGVEWLRRKIDEARVTTIKGVSQ